MTNANTEMEIELDMDNVQISRGWHDNPEEGISVMELVSLLAGEPFSGAPACVSPVLTEFMERWNNDLDDATRQRLKKYAPLLIGTAGQEAADERREWMAADWLVRTYTTTWLRLAGLDASAQALEEEDELVDDKTFKAVLPRLKEAYSAVMGGSDSMDITDMSFTNSGITENDGWRPNWVIVRDTVDSIGWGVKFRGNEELSWCDLYASAEYHQSITALIGDKNALLATSKQMQESAFDLLDRMIAEKGE